MNTHIAHRRVIVAPLDWGLGHATRCIPIIKKLLEAGCMVFIASCGSQLSLLQTEFQNNVTYLDLPGYEITYSINKRLLPFKILQQIPKILKKIRTEHSWLQNAIDQNQIDLVISDNRFGLYSTKVPCVFITHQLNIAAPFKWLRTIIRQINYSYINKYAECWVPDTNADDNIAGELSHPEKLPLVSIKYIGILNRFTAKDPQVHAYDWLIVLSGPEPQRTILEKKLIGIIPLLSGKILLVRGKPASTEQLHISPNCIVANHLPGNEMEKAFAKSKFIVSRCGYTTVMEILAMQKRALLIPTPGQTEQEYLATHLKDQQWSYCCKQDEDLLFHLNEAQSFEFKFPSFTYSGLEKAVGEAFELIDTRKGKIDN